MDVMDRIAAAPISWGVCEVPGWGHQLDAPRVLAEMRELGLRATEFGPDGFLPDEPAAKAAVLRSHGLRAVGGFLPVVLHDPGFDPMPRVDAFCEACLASGAEVVVVAAATGLAGYDARPDLDDRGWKTLLHHLDQIDARTDELGLVAAVHPHIGTLVEGDPDVRRVLDGSSIGLCIDTGHLAAAGADPVAITRARPERVRHVHLKDVDTALAAQVLDGRLPFADAVATGRLWRVLGEGSVDVAGLIDTLESSGYAGWYVLEQDLMLAGEPAGEGPVADVRRCLEFVRKALAR